MIRTARTKDGAAVEVTMADAYSGPADCYSRQHVNTTATWIRIPGSTKWLRSTERSEHRTRMAISKCTTAEDVLRTLVWS